MDAFNAYQVGGFVDFLVSLFSLVPSGFLLGFLCGVLAFGISKLLALFRSLI